MGEVTQGRHGNAAVQKVLMEKKGIAVEDPRVQRCRGDDAGAAMLPTPKGLLSQKNIEEVQFEAHSAKVRGG